MQRGETPGSNSCTLAVTELFMHLKMGSNQVNQSAKARMKSSVLLKIWTGKFSGVNSRERHPLPNHVVEGRGEIIIICSHRYLKLTHKVVVTKEM